MDKKLEQHYLFKTAKLIYSVGIDIIRLMKRIA